jgi:hypothetical protein
VVNGVKGGIEIKRDKNSGFMSVGGMVDMIEGGEESCFGGVIAAVSRLVRVEIRRCKDVWLKT